MAEYIDKSALYEKIAQLEEIARNRYLETPSSNPCCSRYMTQLNERTVFKHIIADFPAADVAPVKRGGWKKIGYKWVCSNCRSRLTLRGTPTDNNIFYCPACGAKMDLGENNGEA